MRSTVHSGVVGTCGWALAVYLVEGPLVRYKRSEEPRWSPFLGTDGPTPSDPDRVGVAEV